MKRIIVKVGAKVGIGKHVLAKCGHIQLKEEDIVFWEDKVLQMFFNKKKLCAKCLKEHILGCAKCGDVIFPGDFISLVDIKGEKLLNVPTKQVRRQDGGLFSVGCSKSICSSVPVGKWNGRNIMFFFKV